MKYLHIFSKEKFTEAFIVFINKYFNPQEHLFIVIVDDIYEVTPRENVIEVPKNFINSIIISKFMYRCEKIFLHNLLRHTGYLLFLQPWLLKKSYWIIWGGDLYRYRNRKASDLSERIRRFVIKNMAGLITHIKGDYELAVDWYGAEGKYYYSFGYPSNLFHEYNLASVAKDTTKVYIQVGNSANPTNKHREVFNKLVQYKEDIKIICPLAYGSPQYRDEIVKEGHAVFGNNFLPIVQFLPFDRYLEILAMIDIAIFNHDRQQAMGNITTLLGLGKKVYVRDDITTWEFFKQHELKVYSTNQSFDSLFEQMPQAVTVQNINHVKTYFSEEKLKADWEKIFLADM